MIGRAERPVQRHRHLRRTAVLVLLLLSLVVRVRNLSSPLTEAHAFRQTQTAITVSTFLTEGIHPLGYQTPVFGPPWRVPMEFPLFQILAALLVRAGVSSVDVACRLTDLLLFYLSAAFLYLLCRAHFESRGAAACILLVYVWLPFTILWSRTSMIDYPSVAFALGYLWFFSRWLNHERLPDLALALACGCLMFLVKLTTSPILTVTMAWLAWRRVRAGGGSLWRETLAQKRLVLGVLLLAVVPTAVGVLWTKYADGVRAAAPATAWLAASLESWNGWNAWNFGTWSQRAAWTNWATILDRVESAAFLPLGYVAFAVAGWWRAVRQWEAGGAFVVTMTLGALVTIVVFFNLFVVHDYYLMSISPAIAIAAGFGFHWVCFVAIGNEARRWIVALVFLAILQYDARPYLQRSFTATYAADSAYQVGRAIADVTTPDERIVIEGNDWSPDYLYYAQRKGLMWRGGVTQMPDDWIRRFLASDRFTTLVCVNRRPATSRFWSRREVVREVGLVTIYKVAN